MEKSTNGSAEAPGKNKEFTIIVNAEPKQWLNKKISYEQVITLAFGSYDPRPEVSYTVNYVKGDDKKPKGTMSKGDEVTVKDQMIFNVKKTDRS